ncbi:MAG TPA: YceI family protein [Chthoniobacterales bacterium]|jgi:polyisoprenoid-binding protein YceI|nr:YceI family protein [Chthoniobacterales bacterium]
MRFRNVVLIGIIALASTSVALANDAYRFDQAHSKIGFSVHQFLGTTNGKFAKFDGKIDIDREHPQNSSVTVRIDVRSIDTAIVKRDNHLRSAEFFAVEKYPEISFKSRSVKQTGPQAGDVQGDLTMHGVTKPVTLHVKLLSSPNDTKQTRWSVTTELLKRRDFNLMFSQSAEAMSGISQTVAINIEIQATRAE